MRFLELQARNLYAEVEPLAAQRIQSATSKKNATAKHLRAAVYNGAQLRQVWRKLPAAFVQGRQTSMNGSTSLRRSVLKGSTWTVLGFGISQVLRLGGNIALAAMLFQEAFALAAITFAIITGLAMFSDLGLGPSVVQNPRGDDPRFLNTAWTIQVIRGAILTAVACSLAWPLAAFYAKNDPLAWQLRWLLPLAALGVLISGFNSSKLMTATRHMQVGRVIAIDLTAQAVGLAVVISVAWLTRAVYALVLGSIASAIIQCALSQFAVPGPRNKFSWESSAVREIVHLGKWIFINTLITFMALQLDKLVFAKLFPLDVVGVYGIAASLAVVTPNLLSRLQSSIAFPLYSRLLDRNSPLEPAVELSKLPMLAIGGYLISLVIVGAQTFIAFAYDDRYQAAGVYIAILAGGAWCAIVSGIYEASFLASGKTRWLVIVNAAKVIAFCVLIVPAAHYYGVIGAVIAVAICDTVKLLAAIICARMTGLKKQLTEVIFTVYIGGVSLSIMWLTNHLTVFVDLHPVMLLAAQLILVTLAFIPVGIFVVKPMFQLTAKLQTS